ncbi:hypothetical protein ACHFJ0_05990 [Paracoccus sp. NGMCC 1.201697]|uniref:DUF1214 domain-containing protein n=1 Tax=Paracoccus broussonetiae subsp. drimophilus TaxID=3373869 RepID=A0ABW7LHI4_9RHOB
MKTLGLIAATLLFLALSVLVVAWPDLETLRQNRNWNVTQSDQPKGELRGVRVFVDQARAMIMPVAPDRAIVYLRLGLQSDGPPLRDWLSCDIGLIDGAGRRWLPLANMAGTQIVKVLGDAGASGRNCDQSLSLAPEEGGPSFSELAFLIPSDLLDQLRLEISAMKTRPEALSLPFRPTLTLPPA